MKSQKWIYLILLLIVTSCQTPERKYAYVDGRDIYSSRGERLHLTGVNLGNWLMPEGYMFKFRDCNSPRKIDQAIRELIGNSATTAFWDSYLENYISEPDIRWLSEAGVNIVRLPFDYRLLCHDDFLGRDMQGYQYLDNAIEWCGKYGIYVLLDMHAAPGGQTGDNIDDSDGYPWLMVDEGMKQKVCDIWRDIAQRYAGDSAVIGYNLLNEPVPQYFDKDHIKYNLEPLYKRITEAIREVDQHHIIFIGGAVWETDFSVFSEPFDDQLAYTFHKYWMSPEQGQIQQYVDFRDRYNVPILMGESGENEDDWVRQFRELLDRNDIHWTFWPYKKMDNTSGPMNFDKPAGYDQIVKYAESDRSSFGKIRALKDSIDGIRPEEVVSLLNRFVENSRFENCYPNRGYCQALGFADSNTVQLFDGQSLDGWYTFLQDRGRDNDPKGVFTVKDGMIRISGEEWGCITTDAEYADYQIVVEYMWGEVTHEPRLNNARDSGLLLHSRGEDGGSQGIWMHSIECQMIEGGTGDFIVVGDGSDQFQITSNVISDEEGNHFFSPSDGQPLTIKEGRINWYGRDPDWKDELGFRGEGDIQKPAGEWNRLECIASEDQITVYLNGTLVNKATSVSPSKGKIQLQSEGAEVFVRRVELTPL